MALEAQSAGQIISRWEINRAAPDPGGVNGGLNGPGILGLPVALRPKLADVEL